MSKSRPTVVHNAVVYPPGTVHALVVDFTAFYKVTTTTFPPVIWHSSTGWVSLWIISKYTKCMYWNLMKFNWWIIILSTQNCRMMSEKISQYYWTVEDVLLFYTHTVILGFQTLLCLQIKPRTQSTQVSQHPNLCPCSLALTPPGALSHSQCPAWCLLTLGSIMLLPLGGSMELWQLPWWLRGPATRRGSHGNEGKDRRGRVCWRWASGHLGKGWSWGETATGEDAKLISFRVTVAHT